MRTPVSFGFWCSQCEQQGQPSYEEGVQMPPMGQCPGCGHGIDVHREAEIVVTIRPKA